MKNKWVLMVLVGLLLLVIAMPVSNQEKKQLEEPEMETSVKEDFTESAEKRLEEMLSQMEGAGEVKVMITLASSSEKIVEKDEEITKDETQETKSEATVYEETEERGQTPYISKELTPTVEGVVVLCEGGDEPVVVQQITESVEALFSVESHKIKVVKMK